MLLRQVTHDDLGCASYLIGDERAGVAAVVDPKLDVDDYLRLAGYLGVRIEHVLETHTHADHVSGHGALAAATGATIHIHRAAGARYPHEPLDDGAELRLGDLTVRALHAPGHRPEHTAFALIDRRRAAEPWAVLTGDSLFVGDLARPDLAVDQVDGARKLFDSLHRTLLALPDACEVWPGHLGGSLCGGPGMDLRPSSTIGFERAHQELLAIADGDAFVRATTAALPPQPPNFAAIVERNRGPLAGAAPDPPPISAAQLQRAAAGGAVVIDVRRDEAFDAAHVPGALGITAARPGFGSMLGWLVEPGRPVVLVGDGEADALRAARLAAAAGMDDVVGRLEGGMADWRADGRPVASLERITVAELHRRWSHDPGAIQVLDVRERDEWAAGHIPGSVHATYREIRGIPDGIDATRTVAVVCGSGRRSGVAVGLLEHHGAAEPLHVAGGGIRQWAGEGWPIDRAP